VNMRAYQISLKLAETRHFGRTAALCSLSPSAVSRHLQRLESRVGQQLVERDNRQDRLKDSLLQAFWSCAARSCPQSP
jgi:LysR family positive regulator for ilvC